jgi:hypothetical protein
MPLGAFCAEVYPQIASDPGLGSGRLFHEYLGIVREGLGQASIFEKRHRRDEIFSKRTEN